MSTTGIPFLDSLLSATGAPTEVRDTISGRIGERVAENEAWSNVTTEERHRLADSEFERVLFAFRGHDLDARIVRLILEPMAELVRLMDEEKQIIDSDGESRVSNDVLDYAGSFIQAAPLFLKGFTNLAHARANALGLTAPEQYTPESVTAARAERQRLLDEAQAERERARNSDSDEDTREEPSFSDAFAAETPGSLYTTRD